MSKIDNGFPTGFRVRKNEHRKSILDKKRIWGILDPATDLKSDDPLIKVEL